MSAGKPDNFSVGWTVVKDGIAIDPKNLQQLTASIDDKTLASWTYISVDPDTQALLSQVFELLPDDLINIFLTHPDLTIRSAAVKWKEGKK